MLPRKAVGLLTPGEEVDELWSVCEADLCLSKTRMTDYFEKMFDPATLPLLEKLRLYIPNLDI